jgi:hypothetical protein
MVCFLQEALQRPLQELQEALQSAVHTLPLVRQLLPDVPVAYDDDAVIPGLTLPKASGASASYYWLICCGSVFLGERTSGKLYASEDATLFPLNTPVLITDVLAAPGDAARMPTAAADEAA